MLNMNRKLSQKGFSLIELMVAVVILVIAVLGIFLAFSNSWMGMADARDRTIAINYAQEILEDIKNTSFEKIKNGPFPIGDIKFSGSIILNPNINPNIKEVTALITWKNRRGSDKNVEASTLIYNQIASEPVSEPVALALYAEPYYNILPGSSSTKLTVLVQDANGNLVTDAEKDILFSVGDPLMGNVLPSSITTQNGKTTVFFTSTGVFGSVEVEASSPGLTSDLVTLIITDGAVAIKLEAEPETISTGGQESLINVSLLDASYVNPPSTIGEHLITLYVEEGPGTITPISVLLNESNGGTSSITYVPILGSAESISITAIPPSINLIGNTEITVTIKDSAGNPVMYSGDIQLSLEPNNGSLSDEGPDYDEETGILTFSNDASSKSINYTASDSYVVDVNITAAALSGELSSDTVTVYISEGRKIKLTAVPNNIIADGNDPSTITATIKDMDGGTVTDEVYDIVFEILSGYGNLSEFIKTTENGVATTSLTSTSELDVITVIARGMDLISDIVTVQTTIPKFISISADPNWLRINDQLNISIDVVDSNGYLADYTGTINLTLSASGLGNLTSYTLNYPGQTTTIFNSLSTTGEVTITADGVGVNSDNITVKILDEGETILTLADNVTISVDGKIVSFDIDVWGEPLVIVKMNIAWNSSSTLNKICFSTTGTCFNYDPAVNSGISIDVEPPTALSTGVSTISLTFSGDMNGQTITVIFYDSGSVPYPLEEFTIPIE